jgi:hypothetical protein
MDMSEEQLADAKAEQLRDRLILLATYNQFDVQTLAPVEVDGESYDRVFVRSEIVKDWMLFFSAEGQLVRMDYQGKGQTGPVDASVRYLGFVQYSGIGFPTPVELYHDGELFLTATIKSVEVNPEVDMTIFQKPSE